MSKARRLFLGSEGSYALYEQQRDGRKVVSVCGPDGEEETAAADEAKAREWVKKFGQKPTA